MTSRERILAAVNHAPVDRVPIDFGGTRQSGISVFAYAPLRRQLGHIPTPPKSTTGAVAALAASPPKPWRRRKRCESVATHETTLSLRSKAATDASDASFSPPPIRVFDLFQMLAEIEPEIAERFGADCVGLNRRAVAFGLPNEDWKPWQLHDGTAVEVPGAFAPETQPDGDLVLRRGGEVIARMPAHGFYFDRFEKYPGALHPDLDAWEAPRLGAADLTHFRAEADRLYRTTDKAIVAALGPPFEL